MVKNYERTKIKLWYPPGFAHYFLNLSVTAQIQYKAPEFYNSELEECIAWNDPTIKIGRPVIKPPNTLKNNLQGLALNDVDLK